MLLILLLLLLSNCSLSRSLLASFLAFLRVGRQEGRRNQCRKLTGAETCALPFVLKLRQLEVLRLHGFGLWVYIQSRWGMQFALCRFGAHSCPLFPGVPSMVFDVRTVLGGCAILAAQRIELLGRPLVSHPSLRQFRKTRLLPPCKQARSLMG